VKINLFKDTENRVSLLLLLGLLIGTFGATSLTRPMNGISYVCFVLLLGTLFTRALVQHRLAEYLRFDFRWYDAIPLVLVAIWAYGFFRGVYFGNDNIYRNFAGMTLYSLYYVFLLQKVSRFDMLRCILLAAAINAFYMVIFFIWDKFLSATFYSYDAFTYLDVRAYYSETLILVAVPIILLFHKLFSSHAAREPQALPRRGLTSAAIELYVYVFAYLQTSLSKATVVFYWTSIFLLAAYYWKNILHMIRTGRVRLVGVIFAALCIGIYPTVVTMGAYAPRLLLTVMTEVNKHLPSFEFLKYIQFNDSADVGTPSGSRRKGQTEALAMRHVQTEEIADDLTLLGKGLGATLGPGDGREAGAYGFEANYLNLAHKFGVFVLFVYFVYVFIGFRIVSGFLRYKYRYFSLASAALFTGIIMGFGNPVLMSPVMVTLQCIALYWLRDARKPRLQPSGKPVLI
jgi:hypothetical protein